jgi:hypothetical protein
MFFVAQLLYCRSCGFSSVTAALGAMASSPDARTSAPSTHCRATSSIPTT